ncbi:hypothetical protein [Escherichia coli]|uniref:hypothetical protein n=1 Tax=Escherichia coli TaxID=562 RepID=UPI003904B5D1
MADINFHPFKNRGAFGGLFNVESRGLMQGDAQDDPAIRLQLCSGRLDSKITEPVYRGGCSQQYSVAGGSRCFRW